MRDPKRLLGDRRGATVVEYALICGFIFLAIVGGASRLGGGLSTLLYNVSTRASTAM